MKQIFAFFILVFTLITVSYQAVQTTTLDINSYDHENLEYSLASPYHTMLTHLYYLQKPINKPYLSAKALDPGTKISDDEKQLAMRLKAIFDGKGLTIDFNTLPKNSDYIDSTTKLAIYYPFPKYKEIFLEKDGNKWFYSKYTVSKINTIYDGMFILGTAELASKIPFQLWQILSTIVLVILSVLVFIVLNVLLKKLLDIISKKYWNHALDVRIGKGVSRPIVLVIVLIAVEQLLPITQLGTKVIQYSFTGISVVLSIAFSILLYNISTLILTIVTKPDISTDNKVTTITLNSNVQLVSFLVKTFKVLIVITGIVLVLNSLTVNITAVLAGLSIGGLALALAAQDTVKNLFGSVMLFIDKPFKVGDYIKGDNIDGLVEEIGFRSTRIRTFEDSLIYIPNGRLADMTIDNYGLRKYRRFRTVIQIEYNSHPPAIEAFVAAIRKTVEDHELSRKDVLEVALNDFGSTSLNILLFVYFYVPTWSDELQLRQQLVLDILHLADKLGIRFAYATQNIHIESQAIHDIKSGNIGQKDHKKIVEEYFENKNKEKPTEN